ncbi:MAG: hypothetical protein HXY20_14215 [Acidobacteria bacterium]|nr:hypothetical protein [Acidobacteriota bacterium]
MHNEYQFDAGGYLTDIILSEDFVLHLDYLDGLTEEFESPPYRLEPDGAQQVEFGGFTFTGHMRVKDLVNGSSETLAFSDAGMLVGYVPENKEASRYDFLALLTDRSFRLLDKEGKEATFTPDGRFVAMGGGTARRMVQSMSMGNHKIAFRYTIDDSGSLVIASAKLSRDRDVAAPACVVRYAYDNSGTLICVDGPSGKSGNATVSAR